MNKTQGVELEIRKDDGNTIMVVQKQGSTRSLLVSACHCRQRQPGHRLSSITPYDAAGCAASYFSATFISP
jgi:hypothetical protein